MGRTTFDPAVDVPSWPWPGKRVYVLTSRPLPGGLPVEVRSAGSVEAVVGKMRSDNVEGDVHLVGGPQTVRAFHAAGLLDRLELLAFPVLVGHGLSPHPPVHS
jgi:dihydrofolate reductase